ncbi:hypothetical protein P7C73_g2595, partial [Tremellales sp. Uapishka_1]
MTTSEATHKGPVKHVADPRTHYRNVDVDGRNIFYREAGDPAAPTILLMHGFPGSSFAYRDLIPLLSDKYHVIAPDMLSYGYSDSPPRTEFTYNFNNLMANINRFTEIMGLEKYILYLCDNGAVVGFRLALAFPDRVLAIVSQNGNAYADGIIAEEWEPVRTAWENPTPENRARAAEYVSPDMTKYQWTVGVPDPSLVCPDAWTLATLVQSRGDNTDIQTDILIDYASETEYFPKYHAYFRERQPPLLAVWGENDPFFLAASALAFKRDLPNAEVHLLPSSHFATEVHSKEIAELMRDFLDRHLPSKYR